MTSQCRASAGDRNLLTSGVGGLESDPEARFPGKHAAPRIPRFRRGPLRLLPASLCELGSVLGDLA